MSHAITNLHGYNTALPIENQFGNWQYWQKQRFIFSVNVLENLSLFDRFDTIIEASVVEGSVSSITHIAFDFTISNEHLFPFAGDLTVAGDINLDPKTARVNVLGYKSAGSWYCEILSNFSAVSSIFGLVNTVMSVTTGQYIGIDGNGYGYRKDGQKIHNGVATAYGTPWSDFINQTISILFDADNHTISFWLDGVDQGVAFTGVIGGLGPAVTLVTSSVAIANFGENLIGSPFQFSIPLGYQQWAGSESGARDVHDGFIYPKITPNVGGLTITGNQPGTPTQPTVLLAINDNAADNSIIFIDQSVSNHTIAPNDNVHYSIIDPPTGLTSSAIFDGSGDFLHINPSTDFEFGSEDFTVEFMVKNVGVGVEILYGYRINSATFGLLIYLNAGTVNVAVSFDGSTWGILSSFGSLAVGWNHVAIARQNTLLRTFINGGTPVQFGINGSIYANSLPLNLGGDGDGTFSLNGNLASVRVTKGFARYTTGFTPPTLPLTL